MIILQYCNNTSNVPQWKMPQLAEMRLFVCMTVPCMSVYACEKVKEGCRMSLMVSCLLVHLLCIIPVLQMEG